MIRYTSSKQLSLPFGGKLNPKNRWVKWSEIIPWDGLAKGYYSTMDSSKGRPCIGARLVVDIRKRMVMRFFPRLRELFSIRLTSYGRLLPYL